MKFFHNSCLAVGLMLLHASVLAHESIGVSIASDVENDTSGTRLFEINYESKSRFVSAYIGYAWFDVPAAYDSSLSVQGVVETRGVQGAVLFHWESDVIQPYIGAGIYGGNIDTCADRFLNRRCKTEETYAFYPEAGIRVKLGRHVILSGKLRHYDFDRVELQDETVALVSIGYFY